VALYGETDNCDHCQAKFVASANGQRFCSNECRNAAHKEQKEQVFKRKCLACGQIYIGRKGRKFCSRICAIETTSFGTNKWGDNDIIYLASLNPGYGFRRFVDQLYSSRSHQQSMVVLQVLNHFKEQTGNDYYDLLQDNSKMETVSMAEFIETTGKAVPRNQGQRGKTVPAQESRAKIKTDENIPFNWGKFANKE